MSKQLRRVIVLAVLVLVHAAAAQEGVARRREGSFVRGRLTYLQPLVGDLDYGLRQPSSSGGSYAPYGGARVLSVDPEFNVGFDLALGRHGGAEKSSWLAYSYVQNVTRASESGLISATNGVPGGGAYDAYWAAAEYNLRRHLLDLDLIEDLNDRMQLVVALRSTYLESEFNTMFQGNDFDEAFPGVQKRKSKFRGGGLEFGAATDYAVTDSLALGGQLGSAFLVGKQEFEFSQLGWGADDWSYKDSDRSAFVPMLEMQLGLTWRPTAAVQISAGYQLEHWFNAILETELTAAGHLDSDRSDLSLHGGYLSCVLRF